MNEHEALIPILNTLFTSLELTDHYITCPRIDSLGMKIGFTIYSFKEDQENLIKELKNHISLDSDNSCIYQLYTITILSGVEKVLSMPDIHIGYDFPIGTVVSFNTSDPDMKIIPSGIGGDINCGMRLIKTSYFLSDLDNKKKEKLADMLKAKVSSGMGSNKGLKLTKSQTAAVLLRGLGVFKELDKIDKLRSKFKTLVNSCKIEKEIERTECHGEHTVFSNSKGIAKNIIDLKNKLISQKPFERARDICSLGSGNHFLEINYISDILHEQKGKALGLEKGQLCFIVHCGSRNYGQQVKNTFVKGDQRTELPYHSEDAEKYLKMYKTACNYAWVNRALLSRKAIGVLEKVLGEGEFESICDISHNSLSIEEDKEGLEKLVIRKGATKALPPGNDGLPDDLKETGQPVIVGGTMGTCSYILINNNDNCMDSTCHGAGRKLSRKQAKKQITSQETKNVLDANGIILMSGENALQDEAPDAYKDINQVIDSCEKNRIAEAVAKLKPIIVIKD